MTDVHAIARIVRAALIAAADLAPLFVQLALAGCVVASLSAIAQRLTRRASFATRAIALQALTILLFVFTLTRVIPHANPASAVATVTEPLAVGWEPAPLIAAPTVVETAIIATRAHERTPMIIGILVATWLAGAAWMLLRMLLGAWQLRSIRRRAEFAPVARDAGATILISEEVDIPFVTGLWSPAIVLPAASESWSLAERRMVLSHESSHVVRGDVAMQWVRQLVLALHWFNPLVRWTVRRAEEACEGACDDAVLTRGEDATRYANALIDLAAHGWSHRAAPAPTIIGRSGLERRLREMVATGRRRRAAATLDRLAPRMIGVVCGIVLATFWPRFALDVVAPVRIGLAANQETDALSTPALFGATPIVERQVRPRQGGTTSHQEAVSDTTRALLGLGEALHDVNPIVRAAAYRALASWKSDSNLEHLRRVARGRGDNRRDAAVAAIAAMEGAR